MWEIWSSTSIPDRLTRPRFEITPAPAAAAGRDHVTVRVPTLEQKDAAKHLNLNLTPSATLRTAVPIPRLLDSEAVPNCRSSLVTP